jgi:hypothetical protein
VTPQGTDLAWLARAHRTTPKTLNPPVNLPKGIYVELDDNLAATHDHGFLGCDGIKTGDYLRIVGKTRLEGGGRLECTSIPLGGDRFLYVVAGWARERGSTATATHFFVVGKGSHMSGSVYMHRVPRMWILTVS